MPLTLSHGYSVFFTFEFYCDISFVKQYFCSIVEYIVLSYLRYVALLKHQVSGYFILRDTCCFNEYPLKPSRFAEPVVTGKQYQFLLRKLFERQEVKKFSRNNNLIFRTRDYQCRRPEFKTTLQFHRRLAFSPFSG